MKTLLLDLSTLLNLPVSRYPLINNIKRISDYNYGKMFNYINALTLNVKNQHPLVGLLQNLSIDPAWTKDYVIAYTTLRSRSLCSAFGIASQNNSNITPDHIALHRGSKEYLVLLENNYLNYADTLTFKDLNPLVPLFDNITDYSYLTGGSRGTITDDTYKGTVVVMGVNMVDLALGWWLCMQSEDTKDYGIHRYIGGIVLPKFQVMHNNYALFNTLYEHIVNRKGYGDMLQSESVDFNTMAIRNDLIKLMEFTVIQLKSYTWRSHKQLYSNLKTIMFMDPDVMFDADLYKGKDHENIVWAFELLHIKYLILYFTIINDLSIEGDSVRGWAEQTTKLVANRFDRLKDPVLRKLSSVYLTQLEQLIKN